MNKEIPLHEKRIVYQVPGMDDVRVQSYVVCRRSDGTELTLDQYLPQETLRTTGLPGVLLVHGGPLRPNTTPLPKNWGAFVSYGQLLAASGLTGFMFNHRYYVKQAAQQAGEDIDAVMAYIVAHAIELGVDATRLGVWAFSGAGKLLPVILEKREIIKSLVLYYTLLEFKGHEEAWADVFARIPICVAQAGLDRVNVNRGLDELMANAHKAKATVEHLFHAQGHHGFDLYDDDSRSREIIAQTIKFIQMYT